MEVKTMANKKNDDDIVKEVVESAKKKPRGKNIGETLAPVTEPGDNQKYIAVSMKLFNLPTIDLHNPEQVDARLNEYFQIQFEADLKPTVAGMAMALGIDRRRLWEIRSGNYHTNKWLESLPTSTTDSIKRAYDFMENLWENYMQNGKINPVSGIFLGKNNFGYQDKTEYVVTPNVNNDSDYNADDIRARYITDSATLPTLDSPDSADS
jgi:hypothetical protein